MLEIMNYRSLLFRKLSKKLGGEKVKLADKENWQSVNTAKADISEEEDGLSHWARLVMTRARWCGKSGRNSAAGNYRFTFQVDEFLSDPC